MGGWAERTNAGKCGRVDVASHNVQCSNGGCSKPQDPRRPIPSLTNYLRPQSPCNNTRNNESHVTDLEGNFQKELLAIWQNHNVCVALKYIWYKCQQMEGHVSLQGSISSWGPSEYSLFPFSWSPCRVMWSFKVMWRLNKWSRAFIGVLFSFLATAAYPCVGRIQ